MKLEKSIICIFAILYSISCTGCNNERSQVQKEAEEMAQAIEDGSIHEINNIIFGVDESELEEKEVNVFADEIKKKDSQGILGEIIHKSTIKVKKIKTGEIEYEIEAPDLRDIFVDIPEYGQGLSEEQFLDYMKEYIDKAKMNKMKVSIPYTVENGKVQPDYQNRDFINAITGGLLESYQKLYQDMMEEYTKVLGDS